MIVSLSKTTSAFSLLSSTHSLWRRQMLLRSTRARGCSAKTMATLAAATGLVTLVHSASAQVWLNPNNGSWSVGANWVGGVPPVSSPATQLTFNATGASSYTAFNDIANPFTLNRMTFGNSGSGLITVNGQPLSFGGATPGFVQNGSGA